MLLVPILFLSAFLRASADDEPKSYHDWSVIIIKPNTSDQIEFMKELKDANTDGSRILKIHGANKAKPFDEFLVSPELNASLVSALSKLNTQFHFKSNNITAALDAEQKPVKSKTRTSVGVKNPAWFGRYLRFTQIQSALQQLTQTYPKLVQIVSIGETYEKRPLNVVKIGSGSGVVKPAIWIDGGIHAREWISPATVLFILNKLITNYDADPKIKNYVDSINWYILPVMNPDGYEYTHTKDRMWRKNRKPSNTKKTCFGVDLNRNFALSWGGAETSSDPCDYQIYRGPKAFSEIESRAVRDFVTSHNDIKAFITLHSFAQMWFYPFGDGVHSKPADWRELDTVAQEGARRLRAVYGTAYQVGTATQLLGPAAGASDDWAKGHAHIKYVYTLELRPDSDAPGADFVISPAQIIPTGQETWAGLTAVADAVIGTK